jgi:hypothetical protein
VLGVVLGIALNQTGAASTATQPNIPASTNVPAKMSILLVLPLVTPSIGLLLIDQFRSLELLGRYIQRYARPQLQVSQLKSTMWGRSGGSGGSAVNSSRLGSGFRISSRCSYSFSVRRSRS